MDAIKILGSLLSSGAMSSGTGSNILGEVLKMAAGGGAQSGGGGLGGLIGGLMGGGGAQAQSGGGLGGLLGGLLGGAQAGGGAAGGLGDLLGAALNQHGKAQQMSNPEPQLPSGLSRNDANGQAEVLVRAMINAAKSDGRVDANEQEKIVGRLGDVSQEELSWLQQELAEPLDVERFARSIPPGMEQQVYAVSLMAIDLDSNAEAQYMHQLAQSTGVSQQACNQIHEQFGVQPLYR